MQRKEKILEQRQGYNASGNRHIKITIKTSKPIYSLEK